MAFDYYVWLGLFFLLLNSTSFEIRWFIKLSALHLLAFDFTLCIKFVVVSYLMLHDLRIGTLFKDRVVNWLFFNKGGWLLKSVGPFRRKQTTSSKSTLTVGVFSILYTALRLHKWVCVHFSSL